jgi:transcriptional regulator with XRE-family HTH domain
VSKYKETHTSLQKRFIKNLKKALADKEFSQSKQRQAGLDPRYICRIKSGEANPTLMTIWRICKTIGVDPSELFKK